MQRLIDALQRLDDRWLERRRFRLDRRIERLRAELFVLNRQQERRQFARQQPVGPVVIASGTGVDSGQPQ